MKLSSERILTTHVGSLPRPRAMLDLIAAREAGEAVDAAAFEAQSAKAVAEIVAQQVACGIDVVSDGEQSKPSYATYVKHRLAGIDMDPSVVERSRDVMVSLDRLEHPDFVTATNFSNAAFPACLGPVSYADRAPLDRDLAHFAAAVTKAKPAEAFMTAPSPGILTRFVVDTHYNNEDAYIDALAAAMRTEYAAIVGAGFLLQIDCPDLGSCRHNQYRHLSDDQFRRIAGRNIAALNAATAGLPPDRMRLHICWGNYEGPHTHDIALKDIIDIALGARPQGLSIEAANPRHEHEWEDLKAMRIPDDKVLIPGVIDSTTNFVEHPRLIAQRIGRFADIVGRERVIAGSDCGFGTSATAAPIVAPSIVWAKFRALAEGAQLASARLWPKAA
ncbi:MAG TPA: cobalamin-independent methionine synthase II family protein [Stellaceae bacterium]|nr:cobalamin-independent methionine synthase II family protein [Stellaceae bacterium]